MNQDKIDRWGDIAGADQQQARYGGLMAEIQKAYQDASLARLRERLEAKGIPWDY